MTGWLVAAILGLLGTLGGVAWYRRRALAAEGTAVGVAQRDGARIRAEEGARLERAAADSAKDVTDAATAADGGAAAAADFLRDSFRRGP